MAPNPKPLPCRGGRAKLGDWTKVAITLKRLNKTDDEVREVLKRAGAKRSRISQIVRFAGDYAGDFDFTQCGGILWGFVDFTSSEEELLQGMVEASTQTELRTQ